jgi:hypothetical protein
MHAVAPVWFEQDGARGEPVLHHDAGIEAEIGADINEDVRLDLGAGADEVLQLRIFADLCRYFEAADIDRANQKVGAEIAADEIVSAMPDLVKRLIDAAS